MGASSDYAVYKKVSGVLKELGNEKGEISKIKSTEYVVKDLHKKSIIELQELLQRQKSILKNKSFLSKLPDKGEKLRSRYKEIEEALNLIILKSQQNNGHNETKKESAPCDSSAMNAFEWTKKIESNTKTEDETAHLTLCNTDEVADPLELLATHSFDAPPSQKLLRNEDNDDPALAIANELLRLEIKDKETVAKNGIITAAYGGSNDPESPIEFSIKLLQSLELKEKTNPVRKQFKPFRPLKNSLSEMKSNNISSSKSKKSSLWTESSATGLFYLNSHDAKLISLQESLRLLGESQKKERDQIYKLTEKSLAQYPKTEIGLPSSVGLHYRDSNIFSHILDDSDDEENVNEFVTEPFEEEAGNESD